MKPNLQSEQKPEFVTAMNIKFFWHAVHKFFFFLFWPYYKLWIEYRVIKFNTHHSRADCGAEFGCFLWCFLTQTSPSDLFFPPLRESFSDLCCWWISIPSFQHLWAISLQLFTRSSCASASMTQQVNTHSCPLTESCASIQLFTTIGEWDNNLGSNLAVKINLSRRPFAESLALVSDSSV